MDGDSAICGRLAAGLRFEELRPHLTSGQAGLAILKL